MTITSISQRQITKSVAPPSRPSKSPLAIVPLDDANFEEIAQLAYVNPSAPEEFQDDLKLIRYIKRLLNGFRDTRTLRVQLVLNHLTVFFNVFQPNDVAQRLLVLKCMAQLDLLKPFLIYMGQWPDEVVNLGLSKSTLYGSDIPMDDEIVEMLRDHRARMRRG